MVMSAGYNSAKLKVAESVQMADMTHVLNIVAAHSSAKLTADERVQKVDMMCLGQSAIVEQYALDFSLMVVEEVEEELCSPRSFQLSWSRLEHRVEESTYFCSLDTS